MVLHNDKKYDHKVPETVTGGEGEAKRNIQRKGDNGKVRKSGPAGQPLDDCSTEEPVMALDQNDPNYFKGSDK